MTRHHHYHYLLHHRRLRFCFLFSNSHQKISSKECINVVDLQTMNDPDVSTSPSLNLSSPLERCCYLCCDIYNRAPYRDRVPALDHDPDSLHTYHPLSLCFSANGWQVPCLCVYSCLFRCHLGRDRVALVACRPWNASEIDYENVNASSGDGGGDCGVETYDVCPCPAFLKGLMMENGKDCRLLQNSFSLSSSSSTHGDSFLHL